MLRTMVSTTILEIDPTLRRIAIATAPVDYGFCQDILSDKSARTFIQKTTDSLHFWFNMLCENLAQLEQIILDSNFYNIKLFFLNYQKDTLKRL